MTPQTEATLALERWQELRTQFPDPIDRLDEMMRTFFAPLPPGDVEYSAMERDLLEIMKDA